MDTFLLRQSSIHLWQAFFPDLIGHFDYCCSLLNEEEIARAKRFHFDEHRHRFVIARALLRMMLSQYTQVPLAEISFSYHPQGKPYLTDNPLDLQFNLSHSHDMAVYAFTLHNEVGVDIEKIQTRFDDRLAKRFFSHDEYEALSKLSEKEKMIAFYHLWAGKEAVIKALGEGLKVSLASFSVAINKKNQIIDLYYQQKKHRYYLEYFVADEDYASAFSTTQPITNIEHRLWTVKNF
ncbi:MAG: phosphopantetheine-protein transferase [uncultured bacterium]|nr:MAG: phosphopantetheine-protein transferase [uncultured bacterium]